MHQPSKRCLDRHGIRSGGDIVLRDCSGSDDQKWEIEHHVADIP